MIGLDCTGFLDFDVVHCPIVMIEPDSRIIGSNKGAVRKIRMGVLRAGAVVSHAKRR